MRLLLLAGVALAAAIHCIPALPPGPNTSPARVVDDPMGPPPTPTAAPVFVSNTHGSKDDPMGPPPTPTAAPRL